MGKDTLRLGWKDAAHNGKKRIVVGVNRVGGDSGRFSYPRRDGTAT
jgi:hypothetical protein